MVFSPARLRQASQHKGIARVIDQAPWKKPEQLAAERHPEALHERSYGQVLPVFMGAVPLDGIVFWRDGPHVETVTTTTTEFETVYEPSYAYSGRYLLWNKTINSPSLVRSTSTSTETRVAMSFAVAHSFNQFQRPGDVLRVEFNDIVIYDAVEGVALHDDITMRVYDGVNNGFDPTMLAKDGEALTPAYHGVRYLFFEDIDLALFDGAIPASIRILWGDAANASDTVVDLDAVTNAAENATDGLANGVTLSGFDPDQVLTFSLPEGETHVAWSAWTAAFKDKWLNRFRVIRDGDTDDVVSIDDGVEYDTAEEARAGFPGGTISGASSYTFFIFDIGLADNRGGLSIRVQAGAAAGTVTLADELTAFSKYDDDRGGLLSAGQVTTEGLAGIVNGGVVIDTDTDLRELASRLAELHGVVKVETATGVKWVLKGTDGDYSPDVVLTEADLAEERSGDAVIKIATRQRNPREIPAEIEVRYISSDAGHESMPARAAWPQGHFDTALSLLKRTLSVPVVLTDSQATELAWGVLGRERAADRTHSIKLRPHLLKVEPSDVFELTAGGQAITGQVTKQTLLPDLSLEITAEGFLSRAATTVAAETPIVHEQPTPSFVTEHVFLDGPLLNPAHDGDGAFLVGYSVLTGNEGWVGASIYVKRASETVWTNMAEYAGTLPVVGTLAAPLPASPWPFETDTENTLTFTVDYGDAAGIASQTEAEFYAAASIIAVGAPGRWMFLTSRNATDNGDGTITLDTLRQGLMGSEVYEGTSLANDTVVLVKGSQAMLVPYELGDVGETIELKAVPFGVDANVVAPESFTVSGAADTPRAPGNLDAVIDGSDIDLTWDRRSRLEVDSTGTFGDGTEAPLGADLDVYKVEILDGPGGAVVRTYADVAGEAATYPDADIATDFGSPPEVLTFRVSQKTSITGIGYGHAAERSVSLAGGGVDVLGAGGGDRLGAGGGDVLGAG